MEREKSPESEIKTQFAALCWRMKEDEPQVLLITSRDTGRWIVPKGWPMKGRSPSEAAAREAWEEAGVTGQPKSDAIGCYRYLKNLRPGTDLPCEVTVFPIEVERLEEDFPEAHQRQRKWFKPLKAARKVAEPGLKQLILAFAGLDESDLPKASKAKKSVQSLDPLEVKQAGDAANTSSDPDVASDRGPVQAGRPQES